MRAVACDLDGTLLEYVGVRRIEGLSKNLHVLALGIMGKLSLNLQKRLARPTSIVPKLEELQKEDVKIILVSNRTDSIRNLNIVNHLISDLNLEIERISLRPKGTKRKDHKINFINNELQGEYEVKAIVEDEPRLRSRLKKNLADGIEVLTPQEFNRLNKSSLL